MILKPFRVESEDGKTFYVAHESNAPKRELPPDHATRCELIQAIAKAVAFSFCIDDVQRIGLVVDEAMRALEK